MQVFQFSLYVVFFIYKTEAYRDVKQDVVF